MKEENKCEHPINAWFDCCDIYNKDGSYRGSGTGRKVARVTWYHLYDPRKTEYTSGTLWKYSQSVGPAFKGAVTHPGASKEKKCYADI